MDKRVTNSLQVNIPQDGFVDEGDGLVSFPNGLTITDGTLQRNGTRYDIDSLDISRYGNQLTADHNDVLSSILGNTIGISKLDGKVTVNSIRYAVNENPYARLAYNLLIGGFSNNFSTETIGPAPDQDGVYRDAELVGLSQVVTQNNYNAHVNEFSDVVHNSLEQSKKDGLDTSGIEEKVLNHVEDESKMEKDKKEKNEAEEVEKQTTETEDNKTTEEKAPEAENKVEETKTETEDSTKTEEVEEDSKTETKNETEETEESNAFKEGATCKMLDGTAGTMQRGDKGQMVCTPTKNSVDTEVSEEEKETNKKEEKMDEKDKKEVETPNTDSQANAIAEAIKNALAPLAKEVSELRAESKAAFNASAKEPEFKKDGETKEVATNKYAEMDWKDRYNTQVDAAWNAVKLNSVTAWDTLRQINEVNLNGLKEAGIARNAMTLDDLGNFVIPTEMYNEIVGVRTDYTSILDNTEWKETLSLEFAWLQRTGDIDMKNVAIGWNDGTGLDGSDDARLKPLSEYTATPKKSELEELAAVTVVATSATRFAAVDLLADAAAGYRNDYDRKRAQLVIAKLEDAVDTTGFSAAYAPSTDVDALTAWLDAITAISDTTLNGTLIFNARTFAELKSRALKAGANGPLSEILTTGDLPTVFGYRFIVVPNDLMPSLGGSENINHLVDGVPKHIDHAVFFADLSTFTGRTSGGLQYDVSNSASYEVSGVTKSAYQRNELVLRGSFFRGGAVKDIKVVSGIRQGNAVNIS